MSSNPTIIIKCVDCGQTKTESVRLFVCSTDLNPKGENFFLCSVCLGPDKLNLDITVLSERNDI